MKNFGPRNTLRWSDQPFLGFSPPFDPLLVEAIKDVPIPKIWDPGTKTWWFCAGAAYPLTRQVVQSIAQSYGVPGDPGPIPERIESSFKRAFDPHAVLGVRADAPDEVVRAAYKALCKLWHPDVVSGAGVRMAELNQAYEQICRERGMR